MFSDGHVNCTSGVTKTVLTHDGGESSSFPINGEFNDQFGLRKLAIISHED
jgi:hypothetical protein